MNSSILGKGEGVLRVHVEGWLAHSAASAFFVPDGLKLDNNNNNNKKIDKTGWKGREFGY